ncbi:hypothetical protein JHK85_003555 [Glycine max]|nr:hypothetical protein JHK85_003555 [Glycine max]
MATSFTICRLAVSGPANGKGFSEFSGLRNSSIGYLSFSSRKSSEDFHSVIAFQTSAVGGREGNTKGVVEAKLKVAINGFGRIGRNFLRCWNGRKDSPLHIIAINDTTGGVKQASQASLSQGLGNRLLIEGTGVFVDRDGAGKHIQAGAKKILITAPGKGDIPTYVVGVNAGIYDPDEPIISNASSTLRQVKLYIGYISCVPRIETRDMRLPNTTHSYGDQRLLDEQQRLWPLSSQPSRDLVVQVTKKTFAEEVNAAFRESAENELKGILSVFDEPLVSVDFRCSDVSSTVDSSLTVVMGDDMVGQ